MVRPQPKLYPSDDTPMTRAIETATSIAKLEVGHQQIVSTLVEIKQTLEAGFRARADNDDLVNRRLQEHHDKLAILAASKARQTAMFRWVGGIVSAVVVGLLLAAFKLRG